MQNRKLVGSILAVAGIFLLVIGIYGAVNETFVRIPSEGGAGVLQVYWDSVCTNKTDIIHWGNSLAPDSVVAKNVYVKNFGGQAMNLTMLVIDWNPTNAIEYLSLTWNREDYVLTAGAVIEATLTLTVFANITESTMGSFSNNIVVHGAW